MGGVAEVKPECVQDRARHREIRKQDLRHGGDQVGAALLRRQAVGGRLNLGIGKQPNRVERIKELAICLEGELKALADLSSNSDDRAIRQSINGFFGEAWFNFFKILCDATSRLPMEPEETSPVKLLGTETGFMNVTPKAEMASC